MQCECMNLNDGGTASRAGSRASALKTRRCSQPGVCDCHRSSSPLWSRLQVRFEELQKSLKEGKGWQKLLRRTAATLRMPTYQVMAVRGVLPQAKREQSMQLTSTRVM